MFAIVLSSKVSRSYVLLPNRHQIRTNYIVTKNELGPNRK